MKYVYPACFYKEEDGRMSVEIPDLNLATYGGDFSDAMYMAIDAAAGRLALMLNDGEVAPKPSKQTDIIPDDETGFVSLLHIDLEAAKTAYSGMPANKNIVESVVA